MEDAMKIFLTAAADEYFKTKGSEWKGNPQTEYRLNKNLSLDEAEMFCEIINTAGLLLTAYPEETSAGKFTIVCGNPKKAKSK